MSSEISVVIPALDAAAAIESCLDGVAGQDVDVPVETLVVDNGSRDATAALASSHPALDRLIREPTPGSYAARNAGIQHAAGPVLAFTDADCRPEPGWLRAGLAALDEGADLVGGRIASARNPRPSVWERYDRALYLQQQTLVEQAGMAATANLLCRREVFDDVGWFDPGLRSSGDLEFCRRATSAGYRLVYAPDAVVVHQPRTTLRATWRLHRRLGAGWAALAQRGLAPPWWGEPGLRIGVGQVVDEVARDGPALRRRQLLPVHTLAMLARLVGRLTGR